MTRQLEIHALSEDLREQYRRANVTTEESIATLCERVAGRTPWRTAVTEGGRSLTYADVLDQVRRVAGWLTARGVRSGDVVTWQLPNWWESFIVAFAIWQVGGVSNPVLHICREHELRYVVDQLRPDVVIAPRQFRDYDHTELFEAMLAETGTAPKARIVVRGTAPGWITFDDVARGTPMGPASPGPDSVALVQYTSGTTSAPKGAMHTARSLLGVTRQHALIWGWCWSDIVYMPAPLAHVTGLLAAVTGPMAIGGSVVLSDRWDAELAMRDIFDHGVTISAGAPLFLEEISEALERAGRQAAMKFYACGGAPVPPSAVLRAAGVGIPAFRAYGMTEIPSVTMPSPDDSIYVRSETDGPPAPSVEIDVVDLDGRSLPPGAQGEIRVRGPQRMVGYVDPHANQGILDEAGWIRTGDVGMVDSDGYLRLTGRTKDIVNRGGEKISARDLEDLLAAHPAVTRAAIVPAPHARLGEVPAAFVVLRSGERVDGEEMMSFLRGRGVARQRLPEHWFFLDTLPMTASGKVKKFELVKRLG